MRLLIMYIVILALGGIVCFLVGDAADQVDKAYGLIAFLALFFLNLWVSWRLAIFFTRPTSYFGRA
jgi:hypothetical protein